MVPQSGDLLPGLSEERKHEVINLGVLGDGTGRMLRNSLALVPRNRPGGAK